MRSTAIMRAFAVVLLVIAGVALAAADQFGVAEKRQITFYEAVWVGGVRLPAGEYQVRHTMEGPEHVMVFTQANRRTPAQARVKCTLTPLTATAARTEVGFILNSDKEQVLHRIVFQGDRAEHVFF